MRKVKSFSVLDLTREDLQWKGYDTSHLTDTQMKQIASRVGNALLDGDFWITLCDVCEFYGLQKQKQV